MAFTAPKIRNIDEFEKAIASAMAIRTMGRVRYPQAREIVNKQRDKDAPFHSNIHDLDPELYNSSIASVIGDTLLADAKLL